MVHHDPPPLALARPGQPQLPGPDGRLLVLALFHPDAQGPGLRDLGGGVAGRKSLRVLEICTRSLKSKQSITVFISAMSRDLYPPIRGQGSGHVICLGSGTHSQGVWPQ